MLEKIIDSICPVSRRSLEEIEALIKFRSLDKRELFIQEGKRDDKEYFVLQGICRSYLLNPKGEEITISFYTSDSVIAPNVTRTNQGLSLLNFQALTDLKLAVINVAGFDQLRTENTEVRNFGNAVLQNELYRKTEKEIGLASLTAKDRLLKFRKDFPMLENRLLHSDIASYLGITNISLSRLRKELKE